MSLPTPASPLEDVEQEAKTHPGIVILSKQKYVPLSGVLYLLSRAFEEGRKHEKTGTFATCDAEGCSETLGLKPYQTGFEMLCSVHGSPCPVDPRCPKGRASHTHEL